MSTKSVAIEDLRPGDLIDLEPIVEQYDDTEDRESHLIAAQNEYAEVDCIDEETPECTVLYTFAGNYAVPHGTQVQVHGSTYEQEG